MRAMIASLGLVSTLLLPLPCAQAQQSASECRYAGMTFGTSTTVRDGDRVLRCGPAGWFADAAAPQTNCLYASGVFTTGAIINEGNLTIKCEADGSWAVSQ